MRRFLFVLCILVIWGASLFALSTDAFTGTGALAGTWTVQQGDPARVSGEYGEASAGNESTAYSTAETWSVNQCSQATIGSVNGGVNAGGVTVHASGTGGSSQYYVFEADAKSSSGAIFKLTSGSSYDFLVDWNTGFATGDVAKVCWINGTLTGYKNGALLGSYADSTFATGSPGLYAFDNQTMDTWQGSNGCTKTRLILGVGQC